MKAIYLVGGAVRDHLLGRKVKDNDFVVVGSTEQEMLDLGFTKVGADFPVFLHPLTGDEYALARKERKVAAGYNGFKVDFDPTVTLEDDLVRRDLTINAMAVPVLVDIGLHQFTPEWNDIIDPFGGRSDLEHKILRHTSEAFAEDPVRVLRVARFAARYEFDISVITINLMKQLVKSGELDALVPERVWAECEKALAETNPMAFFRTLEMCGADRVLFPELRMNDFLETCLNKTPNDSNLRFALACLKLTENEINDLCARLKVPNDFKQRAVRANKLVSTLREKLTAESVVSTLESVSGFQNAENVDDALLVAHHSAYNTEEFFNRAVSVAVVAPDVCGVRFADLTDDQQETLKGPEISAALRKLRLRLVKESDNS